MRCYIGFVTMRVSCGFRQTRRDVLHRSVWGTLLALTSVESLAAGGLMECEEFTFSVEYFFAKRRLWLGSDIVPHLDVLLCNYAYLMIFFNFSLSLFPNLSIAFQMPVDTQSQWFNRGEGWKTTLHITMDNEVNTQNFIWTLFVKRFDETHRVALCGVTARNDTSAWRQET